MPALSNLEIFHQKSVFGHYAKVYRNANFQKKHARVDLYNLKLFMDLIIIFGRSGWTTRDKRMSGKS
jgi:hypothetical protein